jgi:cob(I)alamin adenosyltransferase
MSIATMLGDAGQTSLAGGVRVSKADPRVETYGTVDELNSVLGFARSICEDAQVRAWTEEIQRTLFRVGGNLATAPDCGKEPPAVTSADVERLTDLVHSIEATEGLLSDWSLPGAHAGAAAYEMARTTCRRAERVVVGFMEAGGKVDANVVAYLNRLSDLIWLFGRLLEVQAGVDSRLRDGDHPGGRWSRAW